MKEYKINKGQPKQLTTKQLEKYKDFSKLTHAYDVLTKRRKKPLYKNPKVFIALILLALIAWLVAGEFESSTKEPEDHKKKTITKRLSE